METKGGYGAYNGDYLTVKHDHINEYKNKFKTLKDIREYLFKIRKNQLEYREEKRKADLMPQIIK